MQGFTEFLNFEDFLKYNDKALFRGKVIIKDLETGKVKEDDNLIVLRTRLFALQQLFKPEDQAEVEADAGYITNNNRKVCLFKIGMGGADIQSTALQPFVPKFSDEDLAKPIPFVITSPDKYIDPELEANPSIFTPDKKEFTKKMRETYHCEESNIDDTVQYFAKTFDDNSFKIVFNKDSNTLYAHMTLSIDAIDSRGYSMNELGLLLAEERYFPINPDTLERLPEGRSISYDEFKVLDESLKEGYIKGYIDAELVSRITFDTISLRSLAKKLLIEYRIYA